MKPPILLAIGGAICVLFAVGSCGDQAAKALEKAELAEAQKRALSEALEKFRKLQEEATQRPTDEGFIDWLQGRSVLVERHIVLDDTWTIKPKEVSGFTVGEITRNPRDKTFAAQVSFHATSAGKGIDCNAIIIYEPVNETQLRFISFTPTKVAKLGNW